MICEKRITEAEYEDWVEKYQNALNNQGPERARKIEKVAKIIEQDLNVLGSTAVQDNLQDGVPEALKSFKNAGINVWMLTGDKEETAVNIGFSSGLITNETQRLFINARNQDKLMTQIKQSRDSQIAVEDLVPESVIVVSGESLILIESNQ